VDQTDENEIDILPRCRNPAAAPAATKLSYMPVETWRKGDLARTCGQCLGQVDPGLRAILGIDEPRARILG
jgi:hypothetical protein